MCFSRLPAAPLNRTSPLFVRSRYWLSIPTWSPFFGPTGPGRRTTVCIYAEHNREIRRWSRIKLPFCGRLGRISVPQQRVCGEDHLPFFTDRSCSVFDRSRSRQIPGLCRLSHYPVCQLVDCEIPTEDMQFFEDRSVDIPLLVERFCGRLWRCRGLSLEVPADPMQCVRRASHMFSITLSEKITTSCRFTYWRNRVHVLSCVLSTVMNIC